MDGEEMNKDELVKILKVALDDFWIGHGIRGEDADVDVDKLAEVILKAFGVKDKAMSEAWSPAEAKKAWEKSFPKYSLLDHMKKIGRLK